MEGGDGLWVQNGTVNIDYFTFHGNAGTGIREDGTGSATLTNSILSFSGTSGAFTSGSVALSTATVTYRPGSGTNPSYVNPVETWNGFGTDMNNLTYGLTKGWTAP